MVTTEAVGFRRFGGINSVAQHPSDAGQNAQKSRHPAETLRRVCALHEQCSPAAKQQNNYKITNDFGK